MAELWDAYDRDFNKIEGVTLKRGEPFAEGVYHLCCEIIVKHTDGTYLLMQRDLRKPFGGMWEITAGGCAQMGEDPLSAAIRELKEETGVDAENIKEIKRIFTESEHSHTYQYLCITDCPKDSVTLQEGETIAYRWVKRDTVLKIADKEISSLKLLATFKELDI